MNSARKFLEGIIDYAGLFPPASLSMEEAVRAYATYRAGPDRDLLGRFIVPASRLRELCDVLRRTRKDEDEPWRISVIAGQDVALALEDAIAVTARDDHAVCDALEARAGSAHAAAAILAQVPEDVELYLEIPLASDLASILSAMAGTRAFAKIRTGGVTPNSTPSPEQVLGFMLECRNQGVPFKATAGLHHAVRSEYPLTYESDSPVGTMFGYLNVFLAAAAIEGGWEPQEALTILEERDASCFVFDDDGALVNGRALPNEVLARARSRSARSFGSCSFIEPVSEARALGVI